MTNESGTPPDGLDPFDPTAETPIRPADVSSAARSCSVVLVLLAAILLILCVFVAVNFVR